MSKTVLWALFVQKNPSWMLDGANLTAKGLRKLFETVYDQAHKAGVDNGKAMAAMNRKPASALDDFFADLKR